MNCTYRKTKNGTWAVMGPATAIKEGATVTVTKKNGDTKTETIASVGKTFTANGVETRYGYPTPRPRARQATYRNQSKYCDECGEVATPGTRCWEMGFLH